MFPYQRSLTYEYTDANNTLLPIPLLLEAFKEPVYFSFIFYIMSLSFCLYFFKFIGRRTIVFINRTRINVNNNNNNNNNNKNNNNNNNNNNSARGINNWTELLRKYLLLLLNK